MSAASSDPLALMRRMLAERLNLSFDGDAAEHEFGGPGVLPRTFLVIGDKAGLAAVRAVAATRNHGPAVVYVDAPDIAPSGRITVLGMPDAAPPDYVVPAIEATDQDFWRGAFKRAA